MSPTRSRIRLRVPMAGVLSANGPDDPLPYYYRPLVGRIYRWRVDRALALLAPPYGAILELGYGSGILLPTLAEMGAEVHGIDLRSDPEVVGANLARLGVAAHLGRGDVARLPFPDARFDLVVAISIFEHIADPGPALEETARVLRSRGELLVGMPRVDRVMERLFAAIGCSHIGDHHVTGFGTFLERAARRFEVCRTAHLPSLLGRACAVYHAALLRPT